MNSPSDATGERPVGDALLLLPGQEELRLGRAHGGGTSRGQALTVVWERLFPIAGRIKT